MFGIVLVLPLFIAILIAEQAVDSNGGISTVLRVNKQFPLIIK